MKNLFGRVKERFSKKDREKIRKGKFKSDDQNKVTKCVDGEYDFPDGFDVESFGVEEQNGWLQEDRHDYTEILLNRNFMKGVVFMDSESLLASRDTEITKVMEAFGVTRQMALDMAETCNWDFSVIWDINYDQEFQLQRSYKLEREILKEKEKEEEKARKDEALKKGFEELKQKIVENNRSNYRKKLKSSRKIQPEVASDSASSSSSESDSEYPNSDSDSFLSTSTSSSTSISNSTSSSLYSLSHNAPKEKEKEKEVEISQIFDELVDCNICFMPSSGLIGFPQCSSNGKGHLFCKECWKIHATNQLRNGMTSISCMDATCHNSCRDPQFIHPLLIEQDRSLLSNLETSKFVDSNARVRWCPGLNCNRAIYFHRFESDFNTVECLCGMRFCFECGNEQHDPISCSTYKRWADKCHSEGESTRWLILFTRPCPSCQKPIEKNGGCPHMKCSSCKSDFCWTCMMLYNNGSHRCAGVASIPTVTPEKDLAEYNRYKTVYQAFDNLTQKQRELSQKKNDQYRRMEKYREINSEHWNWQEPYVDGWKVLMDSYRVIKFALVALHYMEEDSNSDLHLLKIQLQGLQNCIKYIEESLNSNGVSIRDKNDMVERTKKAKMYYKATYESLMLGISESSELFRLNLANQTSSNKFHILPEFKSYLFSHGKKILVTS